MKPRFTLNNNKNIQISILDKGNSYLDNSI